MMYVDCSGRLLLLISSVYSIDYESLILAQCGVKQNERVAIASPNTFRFVETYLANAKAGTTTAAIAYMLQPDEVRRTTPTAWRRL